MRNSHVTDLKLTSRITETSLSLCKLMAAIIFISIGVIASFFCAIVDGIIASEFIVSNRTHLHGCTKIKQMGNRNQGWGRIQSDRPDRLISVSGLQRWKHVQLIRFVNQNENSCVTSGSHTKTCLVTFKVFVTKNHKSESWYPLFIFLPACWTILHIYLGFLVISWLRRILQSSGFRGQSQLQIPESVCMEWTESVAFRLDSWFILFCHEV